MYMQGLHHGTTSKKFIHLLKMLMPDYHRENIMLVMFISDCCKNILSNPRVTRTMLMPGVVTCSLRSPHC